MSQGLKRLTNFRLGDRQREVTRRGDAWINARFGDGL